MSLLQMPLMQISDSVCRSGGCVVSCVPMLVCPVFVEGVSLPPFMSPHMVAVCVRDNVGVCVMCCKPLPPGLVVWSAYEKSPSVVGGMLVLMPDSIGSGSSLSSDFSGKKCVLSVMVRRFVLVTNSCRPGFSIRSAVNGKDCEHYPDHE